MTTPNVPAADSKAGAVDQKQLQDTKQAAAVTADQKADAAVEQVKADRKEEQKDVKKLEASTSEANAKDDYFQKVADDDKVFADPYREAARLERQREEDLAKGDPTRDPAAKQAAMDMNTPAPGALEEAEAMRQGKSAK